MRLVPPIAVALALISPFAQAQGHASISTGALVCGEWATAGHDERKDWIEGLVSGIDGADPLNGVNAEIVGAWMDHYCQTHPSESIQKAGETFVRSHESPMVSKPSTQAGLNSTACERQIVDAYNLINRNHPQMTATIMALEDMHCTGSQAACDLGADNRRVQIDANELEKSKETSMVLRTIGCFQQQEQPTAPSLNENMAPQTDLLDPGLPDHDQ